MKKLFLSLQTFISLAACLLLMFLSFCPIIRVTVHPNEEVASYYLAIATVALSNDENEEGTTTSIVALAATEEDDDSLYEGMSKTEIAYSKWCKAISGSTENLYEGDERQALEDKYNELREKETDDIEKLNKAYSAYVAAKASGENSSEYKAAKKELDSTLKSVSILPSAKYAQKLRYTKGMTAEISLFKIAVNIQGVINTIKLLTAYDTLATSTVASSQVEAAATIADEKSYKGVNLSTLNTSLLFADILSGTDGDSSKLDSYSTAVSIAQGDIDVADYLVEDGYVTLMLLLFAVLFSLIGLLGLAINGIILIVYTILHLVNPTKLRNKCIKTFNGSLFCLILLLSSVLIVGAEFTAIAILAIVVTAIAAVINGVAARMRNYTKEEKTYLNLVQLRGVLEFAIGLVLFFLFAKINFLHSYNSYVYRLLVFGCSVSKAGIVLAIVCTFALIFGFLLSGILALYLGVRGISLIHPLQKFGPDVTGRQYAGVWIVDFLCFALVVAQLVFKMPLGATSYVLAIFGLLHIVECIVMNNLLNKASKGFPAGRTWELANSALSEIE